ncbi:MAG: protein-export chaperone SecB [Gammaproteobacteria bacterium]
MASEKSAGNGSGDSLATEPGFELRMIFLKDVSFESPNAPDVLFGHEQPELKLGIESGYRQRENDLFEVSLDITVHAKAGEKSLFILEMKHGGLFAVRGHSPEETTALLRTRAPEALYPYARELIASLVSRGGFPPLLLQPIDFRAHYASAQQHPASAPH